MNSEASLSRCGALPATLRGRLARAVESHGPRRVLDATQINVATLWRALGGGGVYRGTALAIQDGLAVLEREGA